MRPATDLLESLERAGGTARGVHFCSRGREDAFLPYAELHRRSGMLAAGLRRGPGVEPEERVALVLPTGEAFLRCFFGILAAGAVPVPLPPPARFSPPEPYRRRLELALARSRIRWVLGKPDLDVPPGCRLLDPGSLDHPAPHWESLHPERPALVQYTSGSVSDPKGAILRHRHLIAHLEATARHLEVGPWDRACSWLPLHHGMGLIGMLLGSVHASLDLWLMPSADFQRNPRHWLELFGRYGITLSAAPNAAYAECIRRLAPDADAGLDLSTWRSALTGAEPIDPAVVARFCGRFGSCGFDPCALQPVYGLAEAGWAATMPPLGRPPRLLRVDRDALAAGALVSTESRLEARELISLGPPLPGTSVAVRAVGGAPLPEGRVGEVWVQSASVCDGYEDGNAVPAMGLATGDLGLMRKGELYLIGRANELVTVHERIFFACDLEGVARRAGDPEAGASVAIGIEEGGHEGYAILAEVDERKGPDRAALAARISLELFLACGLAPARVLFVKRGKLPRTSAGMLERGRAREFYLAQATP
jgi:acyl-CoA synthetase (AMP-forming)/AMP-acid ligase II